MIMREGRIFLVSHFLSETNNVIGISWYIGDPSQPNNPNVDALEGVADLVLFDYSGGLINEVARSRVQNIGDATSGVVSYELSTAFDTVIGGSYIFALDTDDSYGVGLTASDSSTYSGGYQLQMQESEGVFTRVVGGGVPAGVLNRDTSFQILSQVAVVPKVSSSAFLLGVFALILGVFSRRIHIGK